MNMVANCVRSKAFLPVAILALVWILFGFSNSHFFSFSNAASITLQMSALALLSVGQVFALAVRGFDVSVGATALLASVIAAIAVNAIGGVGLAAGILAGLIVGTFNGFLIAYVGIQPIVTTLGMMIAARGVSLLLTDGGQAVTLSDASPYLFFAYGKWLGLAPLVWICCLLVLLSGVFIRVTLAGKRIVMFGSNPGAADLVGMNAKAVHMMAYQMAGTFAGLAGLAILMRTGAGVPTDGGGMELQSIAAAVIGGTPLGGGIAAPLGSALGAGFIQSLSAGLNMSGISPFTAEVIIGAVIILATVSTVVSKFSSGSVLRRNTKTWRKK